jgi:hypothetical protein
LRQATNCDITFNFRSNGDRFINNELVKVLSLDEQKMVVSRGNGKEAVISRRDLCTWIKA